MSTIVIATSTFYQSMSDLRAQLALQTVKEAQEAGYPIVIVDQSPSSVGQAMAAAGAIVIKQKTPGMGPGRRQAICKALELAGKDGRVVWTEPEKTGLVQCCQDVISRHSQADIIIPGRNREGMESYPDYQQYAEMLGNKAFELITGHKLDMWIGPRIIKPSAAPFFLDYQGEYGDRWDSIFIPVIRAIKAHLIVEAGIVPFLYPQAQREAEEDDFSMLKKRIDQLASLVKAIEEEWNKK